MPPPNDLAANAIALSGSSGTTIFDLSGATETAPDDDPDIWYTWQAPSDGLLIIRLTDLVGVTLEWPHVPPVRCALYDAIPVVADDYTSRVIWEGVISPSLKVVADVMVAISQTYYIRIFNDDAPPNVTGMLSWDLHPPIASVPGVGGEAFDVLALRRHGPVWDSG